MTKSYYNDVLCSSLCPDNKNRFYFYTENRKTDWPYPPTLFTLSPYLPYQLYFPFSPQPQPAVQLNLQTSGTPPQPRRAAP